MSIVRDGPFCGPTARFAGVPRSRANVLDVPLASPANLIIGAENAVARDVDRHGIADRLGRPEHTIEPFEVGSGLVDGLAGFDRRNAQVVQQRTRLGPEIAHLPPEFAQRVEHADEHDDEGRETDRAEHRSHQDGQFAGGHRCSVTLFSVVGRVVMRRLISCSAPYGLGSYQWRSTSSSGRYC